MTGKAKINVVTMGCSKNLVDSEALLGQLKLNNAALTGDVEEADTVVINTCGFIEAAKQESIDAILEAVERKKNGQLKKIVVMGCLSDRYMDELRKEIPDVDVFFGSNHIQNVVEELGGDFKRDLLGERVISTPNHYAFLKISEGCDNPCSFCAIPIMRGKHRSKRTEEVIAEAKFLASHGVKELILIAQDSTYYGLDLYGERRLDSLLLSLAGIDGIEWIRLMYAYPSKFPLNVLNVVRENPRICRYLDIPVQHISDSVLKSMRRGISGRATRELLGVIRNTIPSIALRTTLIVGYPGETDKDFQLLYDFVEEMQFHRLGIFTYSQEDGTGAYPLGDPIPAEVKEERRGVLMELQRKISESRNETSVGSRVKVLIDRKEDGLYVGRTEWDAPEIDQEVFVESTKEIVIGNFYKVKITGSTEYDLYATLV
ncbi:MAG TPA: 30S ribosomal protein S12 methylthiotransferase RimO [Bacteroidota bacterium]